MTRPIDTVLRDLMQPPAPTAETASIADLSGPPLPPVRRMTLAAIAAALFTASLAIGTWSGYRLLPSLVVASAVIYAAYFLYLNGIVYARKGSQFPRPVHAARTADANATANRGAALRASR